MTSINLNVEPYFDDLNEDKKFVKILFRPQFAIQTRELNQLQSLLQLQISRFGDHIFQQGAMVIPGQIGFDKFADFVKVFVSPINLGSLTEEEYLNTYFLNKTITGQTTGVTGYVFHIEPKNTQNNDSATLYIRYTNSGNDTITTKFSNNEILKSSASVGIVEYLANVFSTDAIGVGSLASIERGVYYVNGYFVLVEPQTITLDKYSNTPSYNVGLQITDSIITPEEDSSLYDNAAGYPNSTAPGAHRYVIDLVLTKLSLNSSTNNFIELLHVKDGIIQQKVTTTQYSEIEKVLARRTEDQSGDFVVSELSSYIKEHRNNDRGQWLSNIRYVKKDIVVNNNIFYECVSEGISGTTTPIHTYGIISDGGVSWEYVKTPIYSNGVFKASSIGEFKGTWKVNVQYLAKDIVVLNNNYYIASIGGKSGNIPPSHVSGEASDGGVIWLFYTGDTSSIAGGDESKLVLVTDPGKLYVDGFEIEKTSVQYIELDKSRDYALTESQALTLELGSYVLVNNLFGMPRANLNETVDLRDTKTATPGTAAGSSVGSAKIRSIIPDGSNYRIYIFDIKMNSGKIFERNVKQLAISQESSRKFTADILTIAIKQQGLISTTSSSTTVTGNSTTNIVDFSNLKVNDIIRIEGITSASAEYKIATINVSGNSFTTSAAVTATLIDTTFYLIIAVLNMVEKESTIFKLPQSYIRSLRSKDDTSLSVSLYVSNYDTLTSNGSGVITIVKPSIYSSFAPITSNNYMVVATSGGVVTLVFGTNITIDGSGSLIISGLSNSTDYRIFYTLLKIVNDAKEKTKTLVKGELIATSAADLNATTFSLNPDVYQLIKIEYFSDKDPDDIVNSTDVGEDVTNRFILDNGQRSTYYGLGSVSIKPEFSKFVRPIRITYEYFTHGSGDYFSVNSYPINYEKIDSALRDSLDFRPTVNSSGTFGVGADITMLPAPGYQIVFDFSYYLARKDVITMDQRGNYHVIKGTPSLIPNLPSIPNEGIYLYNVTYSPYTIIASSDFVKIERIRNKRYTMKDIGALEDRIKNLEYYTALSLLEKDTESLSIKDEFGLERFKSGFVVDSFKDAGVALDEAKRRKTFSVDVINKELRAPFNVENINLDEENAGNRALNHYTISEGSSRQDQIFTLPYQHQLMIQQPFASKTENLNPFAVFKFIGDLYLNPSVDEWIDTNRLPNIELIDNTATAPPGIFDGQVIYGAWEWSGSQSQVSNSVLSEKFQDTSIGSGFIRNVQQDVLQNVQVVTTYNRQVIRNTVQNITNRKLVNDAILNIKLIPYIRSRNILFTAKGLKSSTKLYSFFDNITVDEYITPATIFTVQSRSGSFYTDQIAVGDSANNLARNTNIGTDIAFNRGDIIYGNTSGATAILALIETTDTIDKLHVVNVKGKFKLNETIRVKFSQRTDEGTATLTQITIPSILTSNVFGQVAGVFNIPNNEKLFFQIGEREFKITDSSSNSIGKSTTSASTKYKTKGVLETKQASYLTTRSSTVIQSVTNETNTEVTSSSSERITINKSEPWFDPVAQSFLINELDKLTNKEPVGVFISKVSIYFQTKDTVIPVRCEIREMINGFPGSASIPGSVVIKYPSTINISEDATLKTDFIFDTPLYLQNKKEYALVLISDSLEYNVWISQLGDNDITTRHTISEQPYLGVLFKSQNASTWSSSDLQDLKFDLYRAKFDNSIPGVVKLVNQPTGPVNLKSNPFKINTTTATAIVNQPNHGFVNGSIVKISNIKTAEVTIGAVTSTGYTSADFLKLDNKYRLVGQTTGAKGRILKVIVNGSNYVIDISQSSSTDYNGTNSTNFSTSEIINVELLDPSGNWINTTFAATTSALTNISYEGITGKDFNNQFSLQTSDILDYDNYKISVSTVGAVDNMFVGGENCISERNIYFDSIKPIIRAYAEPGTKLQTFLDTITTTGIGGNTPIGNNLKNIEIVYNKENLMQFPCNVLSNTNYSNKPSLIIYCQMLSDTDYLSPVIDNIGSSAILIQNKIDNLTGSNELTQTFGDNSAKYITKNFLLETPATSIDVRFAVDLSPLNDIFLYYRIIEIGNSTDINSVSWNLLPPNNPIPKIDDNNFTDTTYQISHLNTFTQFQVKIVMKSLDSTSIPKIKDLRIIALA